MKRWVNKTTKMAFGRLFSPKMGLKKKYAQKRVAWPKHIDRTVNKDVLNLINCTQIKHTSFSKEFSSEKDIAADWCRTFLTSSTSLAEEIGVNTELGEKCVSST
jgi:hypothetical protein